MQSSSEQAGTAGLQILKRGWATTGEAAKVLNVTPVTVRNALRDGRLEGVAVGGRTRVSIESLRNAGARLPSPTQLGIKIPDAIDSNTITVDDYYD